MYSKQFHLIKTHMFPVVPSPAWRGGRETPDGALYVRVLCLLSFLFVTVEGVGFRQGCYSQQGGNRPSPKNFPYSLSLSLSLSRSLFLTSDVHTYTDVPFTLPLSNRRSLPCQEALQNNDRVEKVPSYHTTCWGHSKTH